MYLFFDTETTGVPKNYKASPMDVDNWPRIIQLAWATFDDNGIMLQSACDLIKPNGWEIPKEKFWIDNGFSTEKSLIEGIDIQVALQSFLNQLNICESMVAHNMDFDSPIVAAEMIRINFRSTNRPKKICTMKESTNICRIPGSYGRFKWPKLVELHVHLFGNEFEGAHDALNDVMACAKCFFEMKNQNLMLEPLDL